MIFCTEPAPILIDTWARGAVPIKRRPKFKDPLEALGANVSVPKSADQLSTGSRLSRGSKTSKFTSATTTGGRLKTGKPGSSQGGRSVDPKSLKPIPIERKISPEEMERERIRQEQLAAIERLRQQAEDSETKTKLADEEEEKRFERLKQELRGKEYTFDHNGNIIVINIANPEKMPRFTLEPAVGVNAPEEEIKSRSQLAAAAALAAAEAKQDAADKKGKGKKVEKKSELPTLEYRVGNVQPPIMEVMKLSSGVTLREGGSVKQGTSTAPTPTQILASSMSSTASNNMSALSAAAKSLTRKAYNEMLDTMQSRNQAAASDSLANDSSFGNFNNTMYLNESSVQDFQSSLSKAPAAAASSTGVTLNSSISNILTDAAAPTSPSASGDDSGSSPTRLARATAADLFNESILNDPSWGSNPPASQSFSPPALPPKPSSDQIEKTVGRRAKLPRERPFVNQTSSSAQRQHLPPPAFPATFGHGFTPSQSSNATPSVLSGAPSARSLRLDPVSGSGSPSRLNESFSQEMMMSHKSTKSTVNLPASTPLNVLRGAKSSAASTIHTNNLTAGFLQKMV